MKTFTLTEAKVIAKIMDSFLFVQDHERLFIGLGLGFRICTDDQLIDTADLTAAYIRLWQDQEIKDINSTLSSLRVDLAYFSTKSIEDYAAERLESRFRNAGKIANDAKMAAIRQFETPDRFTVSDAIIA